MLAQLRSCAETNAGKRTARVYGSAGLRELVIKVVNYGYGQRVLAHPPSRLLEFKRATMTGRPVLSMRKSSRPAETRVQYAALPYRHRTASRTEVLLVTSRETGRWIIPKGWPIRRKTPYATAEREAREEAGVVGTIGKRAIGSFSYEKRLKNGKVIICKVKVFALKVKRQVEDWREKGQRQVQWLSRSKAAKTVLEPVLRNLIRTLPRR